MPIEAATYLDSLTTTNPPGTDKVKEADDHLRLIKTVLKNTLPGLTRAIYLEKARANLASSATPDLGGTTSNYINITGTTEIDGFANGSAGMVKILRFDGILVLDYDAVNFILPSAANITTAAGDHAIAVCTSAGVWEIVFYQRASGLALMPTVIANATEEAAGLLELATSAQIYASTAGIFALTAEDLDTAAVPVELTDAATIAFDWAAGINRFVTLGGNRTLGNPTNGKPGQHRRIQFNQDATGSRTITWDTQYVHPGGNNAVLSTAANAIDTIYIYCRSSTVFEVNVNGKAWAA